MGEKGEGRGRGRGVGVMGDKDDGRSKWLMGEVLEEKGREGIRWERNEEKGMWVGRREWEGGLKGRYTC